MFPFILTYLLCSAYFTYGEIVLDQTAISFLQTFVTSKLFFQSILRSELPGIYCSISYENLFLQEIALVFRVNFLLSSGITHSRDV